MKNIKLLFFISTLLFWGCNVGHHDPAEEDYQTLFPWKGIEKPESGYEDMNIRQCDPEMALHNYRYLGVTIDNPREYLVTLTCSFTEAPPTFFSSHSRYEIKYIDENKNLKIIGSNPNATHLTHRLTSQKEYSVSFTAKSGYPLFLSVNGVGNRASSVKAKITAVSKDNLIQVPELSTEINQNQEGLVKITDPYCEYVVLP